jgi:hypothetical protein
MDKENKKSALDRLLYYADVDNRFQDLMDGGGDKLRGVIGLEPILQEEKDAYREKMASMARASTPVSAGVLNAANPASSLFLLKNAPVVAETAVDAINQAKALTPFETGKAIKNAKVIRGR